MADSDCPDFSILSTLGKEENTSGDETSTSSNVAESEEKDLEKRTISECSICLQPYNLPVEIPCGHGFCFLCIKGVCARNSRCPLCRRAVPADYFYAPKLIVVDEINPLSSTNNVKKSETNIKNQKEHLSSDNAASFNTFAADNKERKMEAKDEIKMKEEAASTSTAATVNEKILTTGWFYEGRNGWWRYDDRTLSILEEAYSKNPESTNVEVFISGYTYVVDFRLMTQFRKDEPSRRRSVRREILDDKDDAVQSIVKGVAGLKLLNP